MENLKQLLDAYLAENFVEEIKKTPRRSKSQKIHKLPKAKCYYLKINFEKIFAENKGETFSEMLMRLISESGEKNSAVYKRAQIDRQHFSKIKHKKNYQPSKDTAVAFALALKLDVDKAKDFLAAAGYTLSKSKRDLIISFFIENKIFDTALLNDYLHEYKQTLLFSR